VEKIEGHEEYYKMSLMTIKKVPLIVPRVRFHRTREQEAPIGVEIYIHS